MRLVRSNELAQNRALLLWGHGAQSTVEYAIVVAVVAAGLIVMQRYVKASVAGRWKTMADTFGGGQQYEPPSRAAAFGTHATVVTND